MSELVIGKIEKLSEMPRSPKEFAGKLTDKLVKAIGAIQVPERKFTARERKYIETIKARLLCLERRIDAPETPSTVDYIAEKKALEWLLEKAGIKL